MEKQTEKDVKKFQVELQAERTKNETLNRKLSATEIANEELIAQCTTAYQTMQNEKKEFEKRITELKNKNKEYETQKQALKDAYNPLFQTQLQTFLNDNTNFR
eukprot:450171_1